MQRKVLLIEPNYKNKYPPIGLMKISTYHKLLGDEVVFFKGNLDDLILDIKVEKCLNEIKKLNIEKQNIDILSVKSYLRNKRLNQITLVTDKMPEATKVEVISILRYYAYKYAPKDYWDRIYITTLFTFYWRITIETIEFAKKLVSDQKNIYVGGVMASLLKNEIIAATGIVPIDGLLDKPKILDDNNEIIIDELTLDYSILHEIDYKYPTQSAYFTFMTKGCTRKCAFCSVPKLEPTYKSKIDSKDKFLCVTEKYGQQRNLLLMDNNVLASPQFPEIIQEIKEMGFYRGAKFQEPNQFDIVVNNLKDSTNDKAYVKYGFTVLQKFYKKLRGANKIIVENILKDHRLFDLSTVTKKGILDSYDSLRVLFEKCRNKIEVLRYVDFNQGTDARYVTEDLMRLMSEIPIRPLRIAFDHIGIRKQYINAVELAAKFEIKELSNYILYNFNDKPEDFYNRLRINIDLGKRLNINIFSFPMKFIPLFGEEAKDRKYIGPKWNRKFLRAIQSILNATKGIVAPGYDFFENAFGKDLDEFLEILHLPEQYIMNRKYCLNSGLTERWRNDYYNLDNYERVVANEIIYANEFENIEILVDNPKILSLLTHYTNSRLSIIDASTEISKLRLKYNRLIREDLFKNLTLTYDFDGS